MTQECLLLRELLCRKHFTLLISSLNIFAAASMTWKLTVLNKSTYQSLNNLSLSLSLSHICNDERKIHTEIKLKLNDPTPWTLITAIQR